MAYGNFTPCDPLSSGHTSYVHADYERCSECSIIASGKKRGNTAVFPSEAFASCKLRSRFHHLDLAKINDNDSFPRTVRMLHFRRAVFSPVLSRLVIFRRIMLNLP